MKQQARLKRAILRERRRRRRVQIPLRPLTAFERWLMASGVFEEEA